VKKKCLTLGIFLLLVITPSSLFFSGQVAAGGEVEKTYPSSASVTYGTPSGDVPDDVSAQDGNTYSIVEEDVGVGNTYSNDTIRPTSDGARTEWNESSNGDPDCTGIWQVADPHYTCVDEGSADGNSTYVLAILTDAAPDPDGLKVDNYEAEDYTLASGYSIDEFRVYGTALQITSADGLGYAMCVNPGGVTYCPSQTSLTLEWVEHSYTWTTNPDDSEAWEDADIDALEIGHELTWGGGHLGRGCCK
jgi:hypothetical protein